MIVDGKAIASEILARTKVRAENLQKRPLVVALVANETPATKSYLRIKAARAADAGCDFEVRPLPAGRQDFLSVIQDDYADAVIIQLPLPEGMDTKVACDAIPVEKDADVLSVAARAKFQSGEVGALLPPVVGAVREIFMQNSIDPKGQKAVVIGDGWLVGNPCATWLKQRGANVTVLTTQSGDLATALARADIIISGAGSPHLIKPEMLKPGVILIDAATSESNGVLAGDADPACVEKCSLFTPVPGGVGPIAVACLFENSVVLAKTFAKA